MIYHIKDYQEHFEDKTTAEYARRGKVAFTNRLDNIHRKRLIKGHRNGPAHLAVWFSLVQYVSSLPKKRDGFITDNGRKDGIPLTLDELSDQICIKKKIIIESLARLCSKEIGWLEQIDSENEPVTDGSDDINSDHAPSAPQVDTDHSRLLDTITLKGSESDKSLSANNKSLPKIVPTGKKQKYPDNFESLWVIHPKGSKKPAYKKFRAIDPGSDLLSVMCDSLQGFKESEQWRNGYSQHLSTWLNEDGWENAPPESQEKSTTELVAQARKEQGLDD